MLYVIFPLPLFSQIRGALSKDPSSKKNSGAKAPVAQVILCHCKSMCDVQLCAVSTVGYGGCNIFSISYILSHHVLVSYFDVLFSQAGRKVVQAKAPPKKKIVIRR